MNQTSLGSFGARIRLAYGLGFLDDALLKKLLAVKEVRNVFAHGLHGLSFKNDGISQHCENLMDPRQKRWMKIEDPRVMFISGVISALMQLTQFTAIVELDADGKAARFVRRTAPQWRTLVNWQSDKN